MKFLSLFALFIAGSLSIFGQSAPAAQKASDGVTILQKKWFVVNAGNPAVSGRPLYSVDEDAQQPADLYETRRVIDPKTKTVVPYVPVTSARDQHPQQNQPSATPIGFPGRATYEYEVKIKNDSSKTVQEISWEYIFSDASTKQEIGRREFTNTETVRPRKEKTLVQRSTQPPTAVISASVPDTKNIQDQYLTEVRIKSIKYSDGSVWQN